LILPQEATVVTPEGRTIVVSPGGGRPFVFRPGDNTAPSAIYEGFRAQRRELTNQLDDLESTRADVNASLSRLNSGDPARKALEDRLGEIDKRIATVDGMLATNSAQLATAAAVPGAVVEPPRVIRQGPPEEAFIVGTVFIVIVLLPLSIAFARRIWKKSVVTVTTFPRELADRLSRMENAVEATSLEVERIGEGQRFLTSLLTERAAAQALPAGGVSAGGGTVLERKQ
jgi:exonuclease VII small subunit